MRTRQDAYRRARTQNRDAGSQAGRPGTPRPGPGAAMRLLAAPEPPAAPPTGRTAPQGHEPGLLPGYRRRDLAVCRSGALADRPHPARRGCHHDAHRCIPAASARAAGRADSRTGCAAGRSAAIPDAWPSRSSPQPSSTTPETQHPDMTATRPAHLDPGRAARQSGDRRQHSASNPRAGPVVLAHPGVPQAAWRAPC